MTQHVSRMPFLAVLATCAALSLPAKAGEDSGIRVDKPQKARVHFAKGGHTRIGELQSLNSQEVKFKTKAGALVTYKATIVNAVETELDTYVYNADKCLFESTNSLQAKSQNDDQSDSTRKPGRADTTATKHTAPATETVVATGAGHTAEDALKDAFRNAVRQVVGAVVDAETLVKDDELISDKVLTYSDGFVETYKEMRTRRDGGLFRTTIKAVIKRRSVIAKLKAVKITVKDIDGPGLFAQVVTDLEAQKNAAKLLTKALDGYPFGCLEAQVVGKPELIEKDETKAKIQLQVRFRVNAKAYHTFAVRLQRTLKDIARDQGQFNLVCVLDKDRSTPSMPTFYLPRTPSGESATGSSVWATWMPHAAIRANYGELMQNTKQVTVAVNTQHTRLWDRSQWRYYILDESVRRVLCPYSSDTGKATVAMLDEKEQTVAADEFSLSLNPNQNKNYVIGLLTPSELRTGQYDILGKNGVLKGPYEETKESLFIVAPMFFKRSAGVLYMPEIRETRTVVLALDDLKRIHTIKCEVGFDRSTELPASSARRKKPGKE